jgi:uncharacterized membrane protein
MTYKLHWHVFVTHFPISLFGAAFFFQVLHLFWSPECFELSTNVTLVAGAVSMVPTTWTGWRTWKRSYNGATVPIFRRKISIAVGLLAGSILLSIWRVGSPGIFLDSSYGTAHWVYLAGNTLLIAGAAAEGFFGGQLNHH